MNKGRLLELLVRMEACAAARHWVDDEGGTLEETFERCPDPDWIAFVLSGLVDRGALDVDELVDYAIALLGELMAGETDEVLNRACAALACKTRLGEEAHEALAEIAQADTDRGNRASALVQFDQLLREKQDLLDGVQTVVGTRFRWVAYYAACVRRGARYLDDPDEIVELKPRVRAWVMAGMAEFDRMVAEGEEGR